MNKVLLWTAIFMWFRCEKKQCIFMFIIWYCNLAVRFCFRWNLFHKMWQVFWYPKQFLAWHCMVTWHMLWLRLYDSCCVLCRVAVAERVKNRQVLETAEDVSGQESLRLLHSPDRYSVLLYYSSTANLCSAVLHYSSAANLYCTALQLYS